MKPGAPFSRKWCSSSRARSDAVGSVSVDRTQTVFNEIHDFEGAHAPACVNWKKDMSTSNKGPGLEYMYTDAVNLNRTHETHDVITRSVVPTLVLRHAQPEENN